jgi:queuine tRNA-ribosyltransferase catalytic subunit
LAVEGCPCSTCKHYTRAFLHTAFKDNNALAAQLLTKHNIAHMMRLMRSMREAILGGTDTYEQFIRGFLAGMFPKGDIPLWTVDALGCAGFKVESTVTSRSEGSAQDPRGKDGDGEGDGEG